MKTLLKLQKSASPKDNLIILTDKKLSNWNEIKLTGQQISFINRQLQHDATPITLDYESRLLFIVPVESSKKGSVLAEEIRKKGNETVIQVNKQKIDSVTIINKSKQENILLPFAEGMALGNYQYLNYKKEKKKNSLEKINLLAADASKADVAYLQAVVDATYLARDLVNEPHSNQTALQLSKEIERLGKTAGFKVEVFNKEKIKSLKMGGLLGVNRGSVEPPTFTIMEWKPAKAKNKKPVILVGKGVVFDTGGLSLKPTQGSMDFMKTDMAGAGTMIAVMYAISTLKLPLHVIGLIPATDNRPGEHAVAPGDVLKMFDGSTVEVLNTDAEGRLILADALSYAKKYDPELVIDAATLTGAAARAIGPDGIVYMGTADEAVKKEFEDSGNEVYERLVEFPLWDEYGDMIKSDIADIKNIGGASGGAITAGKFLEHFIDYPWLHMDIAGAAFITTTKSYKGKNATGVGVRLLTHFLRKRAK